MPFATRKARELRLAGQGFVRAKAVRADGSGFDQVKTLLGREPTKGLAVGVGVGRPLASKALRFYLRTGPGLIVMKG